MSDCIFCKIISREIDSKRVYEDENNLAFLDIQPAAKGHTLVIPKYHAVTIYDLPEDNMKALGVAVKRVAIAVKQATGCQGINVLQSNEKAAGQEVEHVHFHVVPRTYEDGNDLRFARVQATEEEQKIVAKKIRENVPNVITKKEDKITGVLDRIDSSLKDLDNVLK